MTTNEAAKKLGWSVGFLRAMANQGKLPFCIAGKRRPDQTKWSFKINENALDKFIEGNFTIVYENILKERNADGNRC